MTNQRKDFIEPADDVLGPDFVCGLLVSGLSLERPRFETGWNDEATFIERFNRQFREVYNLGTQRAEVGEIRVYAVIDIVPGILDDLLHAFEGVTERLRGEFVRSPERQEAGIDSW
ncbi:hypothetical protein [Tuwongella immobilis]|uniref:hypothetical protein n=1 Tax=Tuwongella immobilis TaxID=692036 RepID=UPI0013A6A914|nr:hypothetical protein [Tuwongella immobilis]